MCVQEVMSIFGAEHAVGSSVVSQRLRGKVTPDNVLVSHHLAHLSTLFLQPLVQSLGERFHPVRPTLQALGGSSVAFVLPSMLPFYANPPGPR